MSLRSGEDEKMTVQVTNNFSQNMHPSNDNNNDLRNRMRVDWKHLALILSFVGLFGFLAVSNPPGTSSRTRHSPFFLRHTTWKSNTIQPIPPIQNNNSVSTMVHWKVPSLARHLQADNADGLEKGDKDDCFGPNGVPIPCLADAADEDGFIPGDELPGPTGPEEMNLFNPRLENRVRVRIFVRLKSTGQSIGHSLTSVVSNGMGQSMDNVNIYLPPGFEDSENSNSHEGGWPSFDTEDGVNSNGSATRHDVNGDQNRRRNQNQNGNRLNRGYDMYYTERKAAVMKRGEKQWWWRYTIVYNCFWGDNGEPVASLRMRASMSQNMTTWVDSRRLQLRQFLQNLEGDPTLELTTDENVMWVAPDDLGGKIVPTEQLDTGLQQPLDSGTWTWYRYLGLILFVTVMSGSLLLAQLGSMRRRRRIKKQVWSNLASEDGVKELLKTGWILTKSNHMEVYDRSKVGYNDNDSMLIGGFQQREAVVGTEITINGGTNTANATTGSTSQAPLPSVET